MNRKTKFISNRANKPRKHTGGLVVLDAKQLASEIAKIVEASFYKHNNMPSAKSYHFAMKSLPKILEDFYPQDYRRLRNAGLIRNRPLTGRISEVENVKKAAFTTFIGKVVAPDVMRKADFKLSGKYGIEMVLKRIEIGTGERNSSSFTDNHVTIPIRNPNEDEENMSNKDIVDRLNFLTNSMSELTSITGDIFTLSTAEFRKVNNKIDGVETRLDGFDKDFEGLYKHFGIPRPK